MTHSRSRIYFATAVIVLGVAAMVWEDAVRYQRVMELSAQGNPPPKRDSRSPTGYVNRQRYFLGAQLRGETFRWIGAAEGGTPTDAATVASPDGGENDLAPRRVAPSIYGAALKLVAKCGNLFWNEPDGIAVERAAVVMPLAMQGLLLAVTVAGVALCWGFDAAWVLGGLLLFAPYVSDQLLPGVLEPRGAAMFCGADALLFACAMLAGDKVARPRFAIAAVSAVFAFVALWLDPAVGMAAIMLVTAARLVAIMLKMDRRNLPWLWWGGLGAALTVMAAWVEHMPLDPKLTEFRGIHPIYALAWLGAAYLVHTGERIRTRAWRWWVIAGNLAAATGMLALPFVLQIVRGYPGWLRPDDAMERLTSLETTPVADTVFAWSATAPGILVLAVLVPIGLALDWAIWSWVGESGDDHAEAEEIAFAALVLLACTAYGAMRIRWLVIAAYLACFMLALAVARVKFSRRTLVRYGVYTACGLALVVAGLSRLASIKAAREQVMGWADLEALVYRDLAQWLVIHAPPGSVGVLAPPDMADSLAYHGDFRGLITTAWEQRDNALTASRILSSVLPEEAEALLQKRRITYLAVPSWDKVLSRLVRVPEERRKFALLPRLERWAPPRILKPIPYQLPPVSGMEGQTIALYEVVDPQDEALALSRLAEYFAEMDMDHLAAAAAKILGTSYPGDPNASIARALVFNKVGDRAAFEEEVLKVAGANTSDDSELDWDRQVVRATVLALANRNEDAAKAVAKCLADASETHLYALTPLQVYRLNVMARKYGLAYPTTALSGLAAELSNQLVGTGGDGSGPPQNDSGK